MVVGNISRFKLVDFIRKFIYKLFIIYKYFQLFIQRILNLSARHTVTTCIHSGSGILILLGYMAS